MSAIKTTDVISLHYTGTLSTGEQFDSSEGRAPLEFEVGSGQVIPGFDAAVMGMKVGESKKVKIAAAEAYGEVMEDMIYSVPKDAIPADLNPHVGLKLVSTLENGHQIPVTITEVTDESITIDANHELAGQDLTFDITIVSIN